jgi:glutathione peroxidase
MILGFPCNQFGNQEPKTNEEIQKFIRNKNVRFPIFGKIDVNGKNEDPLYSYLKNNIKGILGKNITWNFTKFLCIYGIPVERYGPKDNPKSFEKTIKDYLDRNDNI